VRQAKVHVIHQLTKNVGKLKKKKTNDEKEREKNSRKVGRFVEEIKTLRKEEKDVIGKWVLMNRKSLAEIGKEETLQQKFDMRVRALTRIAEHKTVQKVVTEVREKFPRWEKQIPKLIKALGKTSKKGSKAGANDLLEVKTIKKPSITEPTTVEVDVSNEESEMVPLEEDSDASDNDDALFINSLKSCLKSDENNPKSSSTSSLDEESDTDEEVHSGDKLVKVLDLKSGNIVSAPNDDLVRDKPTSIKPKTSSSFFLGGESESESSEEEEETHWEGVNVSDVKPVGMKRKFDGGFENNRGRGKYASAPRGRGNTQPRGGNFHQSRRPEHAQNFSPKVSAPALESKSKVVDPSFHPSWVAKQKSKPSIQAFQGKKTVFED